MKTQLIQLDQIVVGERVRKDHGDVSKLADSINHYGLIQPLLVSAVEGDYQRATYRLVVGERRLRAVTQLGWREVPCVLRETLNDAERAELELEENVRRKDMDWRERVQGIAKVHAARLRTATLAATPWGYEQTGELLGVVRSDVHYALHLAKLLNEGDAQIAECETVAAALQLMAARKEAAAEHLFLSRRVDVPTQHGVMTVSVHTDPIENVLGLIPNIVTHLGDSIEWLRSQPDASLDCVYTDPPYGIDMDNLEQQGTGMNVSTVRATHDVEESIELVQKFITIVRDKLKPTSFCVVWTDFVHLHWLSEWADIVGLRTQRWPLVWVKTSSCLNQAAHYNFTKATECAMVFSRESAVLARPATTNYWIGPGDKPDHQPTNPFWKPLAIHRWVLAHIAAPGCTICDPFAGSGSIPLAAIGAGYSVVAVEKDEKHYLDMCTRLKVL